MYFKYMIVSPVKKTNISSFLFISILCLFSYLIDLAKTSNTTLRVDTWSHFGFSIKCFLLFSPFSFMLIFSLESMYLVTFNDFPILNCPYIPEMKLTWSWCMIFLTCS